MTVNLRLFGLNVLMGESTNKEIDAADAGIPIGFVTVVVDDNAVVY